MKKLEMITKTNENVLKIIRNATMAAMLAVFITSCGGSSKENIMLENRMADTTTAEPVVAANLDINTNAPADKKFIKTADLKFRVRNALLATERIEDLTSKYGGYTLYSNLQNRNDNYKSSNISRDSILISTQITVVNNIRLKIPGENLDSFIRQLNPLVSFFDYRVIKLNDVTLDLLSHSQKADRLQTYERRQARHIDSENARLKEKTTAEDNLLDKQMLSDNLQIASKRMEDDVKYCTVSIEIYQQPIIVREIIANFEYIANQKPSILKRVTNSLVDGWQVLEEIIVFLVRFWGIILIIIALIAVFKYLRRFMKKI